MAQSIVPVPASVRISDGASFEVDSNTTVVIDSAAESEVEGVGRYLSELLATSRSTVVRRLAAGETPPPRSVFLTIDPRNVSLGAEGYELTITAERVTLVARAANGLFYGVQTMRQLLPPAVEHRAARGRTLRMPAGRIVDAPRFAWRGAMLDVARHFLGVSDVKRYVDVMALYKLNRLHLHLADDQGWRIEIKSWPNLARHGGSTQLGIAPSLYTETKVGFSSQCVDRDTIGAFVDSVVHRRDRLVAGVGA